MPAPEGSGPGESPGLFASIRSFWSVVAAIFYTRLDLLTTELEDEATRAVRMVISGAISLLAFHTAFFFAMLFILAAYWDTHYRLWVIGGIFGVYLIIAVAAALAVRNMLLNRPKFLSQTITELRRDAETLSRAVATKQETP
jgi:uncharacterized membrane protein YqjE